MAPSLVSFEIAGSLIEQTDSTNQIARWAFTLSNAGSYFFEDRKDLVHLEEINWMAVRATDWREHQVKMDKQAEFLVEHCFPWSLIERIGVQSASVYRQVINSLPEHGHKPSVEVRPDWYY